MKKWTCRTCKLPLDKCRTYLIIELLVGADAAMRYMAEAGAVVEDL